jgi:hypothetical protein
MARQGDEYAVGAWPTYQHDEGEPPLIAYATNQELGAALQMVGCGITAWGASEWPTEENPPQVAGFEIHVSRPGWPDPDVNY